MLLRETLTFLAGLVILLLLAALVGPSFVDWNSWRAVAETRLSMATGVPVHIGGGMDVRLLPVPRLQLGQISLGDPGKKESHVTIADLRLEIAPSDLLRGRVRINDASADGVSLILSGNGVHGFRLPSAPLADFALEHMRISRSVIQYTGVDGSQRSLGPVALEMTAPQLAGPWRVEGEIGGLSLRLVTGEPEANGRTRARLSLNGSAGQSVLDGALVTEWLDNQFFPGFDGTLSASLSANRSDDEKGSAPATVSSKLILKRGVADLSGLSLLFGDGVGRLEGTARLDLTHAGPSNVALRAKRIDPAQIAPLLKDALASAVFSLPLPEVALAIDVDQMVVRGEETGETSLRGWLGPSGLGNANFSTSLAGARVGFNGTVTGFYAAKGALNVAVPDTRRLALALNRMGLEAVLADGFSALGTLDVQASGEATQTAFNLTRAIATTQGGRLEASGQADASQINGRISLDGLAAARVPVLGAMAGLLPGHDITLDIGLTQMRVGTGPAGEAQLLLRRKDGVWQPGPFSARGFGGLTLAGNGQGGTGGISGQVNAPQADVVLALAGPFMPPDLRNRLSAMSASLSPLALRYDLKPSGEKSLRFEASGTGGRTRLRLAGERTAQGQFGSLELVVDLPERALLFQGLGLARPAADGPAQLTVSQSGGQGGMQARLMGSNLSILVQERGLDGLHVTATAGTAGLLLPSALAQLLPEGALTVTGQLVPSDGGGQLEKLNATLGGLQARGRLALAPDGLISGELTVPRLTLPDMASIMLRSPPQSPPANDWSSARFLPPAVLPALNLAVSTPQLMLGGGQDMTQATFNLASSPDELRFSRLAGRLKGGSAGGHLNLRRDGGLATLSGRLDFERLDAAHYSAGEVTGQLSGQFDFGASGESPSRLIAALGGTGSLRLTGGAIARLDPAALGRVVASTGDNISDSDKLKLAERTRQALMAAAWPIEMLTLPVTITGGIARLQPVSQQSGQTRVEMAGTVDLRAVSLDVRATLSLLGSPAAGWSGAAPQVALLWRGPLGAPRREVDAASLANAFAARALAREIERVEAFEADIRERSFFARRLRAERDMREAEAKAAEAARLAEIQRILDEHKRLEEERGQTAPLAAGSRPADDRVPGLQPLPLPLDIRPVPAPFSRSPSAN